MSRSSEHRSRLPVCGVSTACCSCRVTGSQSNPGFTFRRLRKRFFQKTVTQFAAVSTCAGFSAVTRPVHDARTPNVAFQVSLFSYVFHADACPCTAALVYGLCRPPHYLVDQPTQPQANPTPNHSRTILVESQRILKTRANRGQRQRGHVNSHSLSSARNFAREFPLSE